MEPAAAAALGEGGMSIAIVGGAFLFVDQVPCVRLPRQPARAIQRLGSIGGEFHPVAKPGEHFGDQLLIDVDVLDKEH